MKNLARLVFVKLPDGRYEQFDTNDIPLELGDNVVVETKRGTFLGMVISKPVEKERRFLISPGKVIRKATEEDLEKYEENKKIEKRAFDFCLRRIKERGFNMKLVKTELLLDRSKLLFYFTAEKRVDFRELVRDLASEFRMRIEMRQIGVRDEAKMISGVGSCGRELCCAKFMNRFDLVSVKMAKEQNLALNPTKISGICGRLMCCLSYEFPVYLELKKDLPKVGKRINTKAGPGKVIRQNVLNQTITVELEGGGEITLHVSEIQ